MTDGRICTLADVNGMTYEDFIARFGGVAEHGKLVAASVWICRPFRSVDHLCRTFGDFMDTLPDSDLSKSRGISSQSRRERAAAGLGLLTAEEQSAMSDLNERYCTKFGFPFVICVRENRKGAILNGLKTRLENDQKTETESGLAEVKKICRLRLLDLVMDTGSKL